MMIVQQDELEEELAHTASLGCPSAFGSEYFIVGVVEPKFFKAELTNGPSELAVILNHTSDIIGQFGFSYSPRCWCRKDTKPPILAGSRPQRIPISA